MSNYQRLYLILRKIKAKGTEVEDGVPNKKHYNE